MLVRDVTGEGIELVSNHSFSENPLRPGLCKNDFLELFALRMYTNYGPKTILEVQCLKTKLLCINLANR